MKEKNVSNINNIAMFYNFLRPAENNYVTGAQCPGIK